MCNTLAEVRKAVEALLARFDPVLVPKDDLATVLRDAGAVEKMMASLASLTAAHMAQCGPRAIAPHQAARDLAHATGTSLTAAHRALQAAQVVAAEPEVAGAARAGELSRQQLALVAEAVGAGPAATGRLLDLARTASVQELAAEAARARAAGPDFEGRRQAIRARRYLREWTDAAGAWNLAARGLPEDGAKVMAAVRAYAEREFNTARKQGRRDAPAAYAYDGLVAMAGAGGAAAPHTDILVRVDHAVIVRGYALDGEICEIAGVGPISAQAVYDIIETGDPFLKAVVTKGKEVVGVAHLGRRPNAHQRTALDWLFPTCAALGCGTRGHYLETDHRQDWARTHVTVLDLLDRLCHFDHYLKTTQGWSLVEGQGKRPFVPPDDPRHPRNSMNSSSIASAPPGTPPAPPPSDGRDAASAKRAQARASSQSMLPFTAPPRAPASPPG